MLHEHDTIDDEPIDELELPGHAVHVVYDDTYVLIGHELHGPFGGGKY
jgi:hypothetical protein